MGNGSVYGPRLLEELERGHWTWRNTLHGGGLYRTHIKDSDKTYIAIYLPVNLLAFRISFISLSYIAALKNTQDCLDVQLCLFKDWTIHIKLPSFTHHKSSGAITSKDGKWLSCSRNRWSPTRTVAAMTVAPGKWLWACRHDVHAVDTPCQVTGLSLNMLCCTVTPSWQAWACFTDASTLGTVSEAPDANGSQQRTTSRAQSSSFSFTSACSKQSAWRSHHILSPCSRKEYAFLGTAFKKFMKRATSQRSRQESFWYLHRLLLMMAAFQFSQASCSFPNYESNGGSQSTDTVKSSTYCQHWRKPNHQKKCLTQERLCHW